MDKEAKIKALEDEIFSLRMGRSAIDKQLEKKYVPNEAKLYRERRKISDRISKLRDQRDALAKKSTSAKRKGRVLCEGYPFAKGDIIAHMVAGCAIISVML